MTRIALFSGRHHPRRIRTFEYSREAGPGSTKAIEYAGLLLSHLAYDSLSAHLDRSTLRNLYKTSGRLDWKRRIIAAFGAALLFAAQLIAAGHVHPWVYVDAFSNGAQQSATEAACPVCALHAQTPVSTTSAPVLIQPLVGSGYARVSTFRPLFCAPAPQLFGRAPPAPL